MDNIVKRLDIRTRARLMPACVRVMVAANLRRTRRRTCTTREIVLAAEDMMAKGQVDEAFIDSYVSACYKHAEELEEPCQG